MIEWYILHFVNCPFGEPNIVKVGIGLLDFNLPTFNLITFKLNTFSK